MENVNLAKYNRTKYAQTHKCVWCETKDSHEEFEFELGFNGWLCKQCIRYLTSRGENVVLIRG